MNPGSNDKNLRIQIRILNHAQTGLEDSATMNIVFWIVPMFLKKAVSWMNVHTCNPSHHKLHIFHTLERRIPCQEARPASLRKDIAKRIHIRGLLYCTSQVARLHELII